MQSDSHQVPPEPAKIQHRTCVVCRDMPIPQLSTPEAQRHSCINVICLNCRQKVLSDPNKDPKCWRCTFQFTDSRDLIAYVGTEGYHRYLDRLTKQVLRKEEAEHFVECPRAECGWGILSDCKDGTIIHCPLCKIDFCGSCKSPAHEGESCAAFQARSQSAQQQALFGPEAETPKEEDDQVKLCPNPNCRRPIQKHGGCEHFSCLCGHQFCYECLATHPGHLPHCSEAPPQFPSFIMDRHRM